MTSKPPPKGVLQGYANRMVAFIAGFALMYFILFTVSNQIQSTKSSFELQLPLSMAKEPLLISACGQSTDAYLLQDLLTELRMDHQFIPQATTDDLRDMSTLIVTLGYSPTGLQMLQQTFEDEYNRIYALTKAAKVRGIPVIAVYLGTGSSYKAKNLTLLKAIMPNVDRFIVMHEGVLTRTIQQSEKDIVTISRIEDLKSVIISSLR